MNDDHSLESWQADVGGYDVVKIVYK